MPKKRRTRKDKERGSKKGTPEPNVKRQNEIRSVSRRTKFEINKNSDSSAKNAELASQKKDIIKSLIMTSFILGVELVIYLALRK